VSPSLRPPSPRAELLAPAGDWDCVKAAVENGADAVYFGLSTGFNARARATNFGVEDVPAVMAFLHARGVQGFVTLNTLAFSDELPAIERLIRQLTVAGVDALLVQDFGVARLARAVSPALTLHASTQMTLTSAECIAVAAELGITRVVLARELSLDEIRDIRSRSDIELEVFVHGALCVAYSGQCLTSESLGGRSANRGQCAQACRLPYDLVCDGRDVDLGDQKYLLSPQDLAAYALTPDLLAAGVCSFKIEGRLKTAEYVANITRHYRRALDDAVAGQPVSMSATDVREMELSFSRGFSPGWLAGNDHKMLVPGLSSAKRGIRLGEVINVDHHRVHVRLSAPVKRGDGVVFAGDRASGDEQGGRIYGVFRGGLMVDEIVTDGIVQLEFAREALDLSRLHPGQPVWKTDDPELTQRLRKSYTAADPLRRVPVRFTVRAATGEPLTITATTDLGTMATVTSPEPLAAATKHPASTDLLEQQLARLGHTVYEFAGVTADIVGEPMVPISLLSQLRRELIAELDRLSQSPPMRPLADGDVLPQWRAAVPTGGWVEGFAQTQRPSVDGHLGRRRLRPSHPATHTTPSDQPPRLRVMCRSLEQLRTVLELDDVAGVLADFADIREYSDAVALARAAGVPLLLAPPRIQKPGEQGLFRALAKHAPDGLLARNLAGLRFCADEQLPCVADYSLNATNELTVQHLLSLGAARVTASYDLNREQLLGLVAAAPADRLEVVIHQHMPMFHMEHCVFCAVLSPGTNKTNCGRPCDTHVVHLRDRVGMEHRLTADVGCRNTLFNATPQSAAEALTDLLTHGVRDYRIELLDVSSADVRRMVGLYRDLLAGRIRSDDVWRSLKASNRVGVTRGTLEERRNPLAIL
jgi:U32 family peptidase